MPSKEKLMSGAYMGGFFIAGAISKRPDMPYKWLIGGHVHDVTLPVILYFFSKLTNSPIAKNPYANAGTLFLAASALEVGQKFGLPLSVFNGTYDPWDFVAYALGGCLAIGLEKLTFRRRTIDSLVGDKIYANI